MTDHTKGLADIVRRLVSKYDATWPIESIDTLVDAGRQVLAAYDAAQGTPQAVPNTNSMEPIVYHLDDGKEARGMRVGPSVVEGESMLVVDLTFGDGPSVIGKDGWFQRGYVECYGGLVPESASEGTEPGQWSYGVLKCNREIDAAQAQKPVLASRNDLLREFAERFTLDGDYLRCRECNRPQIASRESEEFVHAASCKLSVSGGRPWVELQAILVQPAAAQASPAPTDAEIEAAVKELVGAERAHALWDLPASRRTADMLRTNLLALIARLRGGAR